MNIENLTDKELINETFKVVKIEKKYSFEVLRHLSEIYKRRLYLDFNCSSLYDYCRRELKYTSGESQYRIAAVKLMQKSSKIEKALEQGELPLSNAVLLHNHLETTQQKDTKTIEDLAAHILNKSNSEAKHILKGTEKPKNTKKPKTQKIKLEIDTEIQKLLVELAALTGKDKKQSLKLMLTAEIQKLKSKRNAQAAQPAATQKTKTRYIPQSEKAKVLLRANGRCEHIDDKGERCTHTEKLQFEHIHPHAAGGGNGAENLKFFCGQHNLRAAIKFYGKDKIQNKICNVIIRPCA